MESVLGTPWKPFADRCNNICKEIFIYYISHFVWTEIVPIGPMNRSKGSIFKRYFQGYIEPTQLLQHSPDIDNFSNGANPLKSIGNNVTISKNN